MLVTSFLGLVRRVIAYDTQPGMWDRKAFCPDSAFHLCQVKEDLLTDLLSVPLAASASRAI